MMSNKRRATLHPIKSLVSHEKKVESVLRSKIMETDKPVTSRQISRREIKLALQQDVDKLKKKLRYEENIHRALERAFTRPLGSLPRLPPYLSPCTLELLAEVAVLEEEVARLEEQVVLFRQDLYREAVYISSSKRNSECLQYESSSGESMRREQSENNYWEDGCSASGEQKGKENLSCTNMTKKKQQSTKAQPIKTPARKSYVENKQVEKLVDSQKLQLEFRNNSKDNVVERTLPQDERKLGDNCPNAISESMVKCLVTILLRMRRTKSESTAVQFSSLASSRDSEDTEYQDPYGICSEMRRDVGPYKSLCSIDSSSINVNRTSSCLFLLRRKKILLEKLASVKLQGLTHQQKLAFWINIYNSCMMNAFIDHGVSESPETVVALMQEATITVGGHVLNAITIEHFILRLPYHSKYASSKGTKYDEITARTVLGLELSEPLVTFALSCGSWSSPAVRVYTAPNVEHELEVAKKDYIRAAVGISKTGKLMVPKMLDWYLFDFAKDLESLLDWIYLQLPIELRKEAITCLERGKHDPVLQCVQVIPYEFSFRYLLHIN